MKQVLILTVLIFAANAQAFTFHVAEDSYLTPALQKSISDYVRIHCKKVLHLEENTTSLYTDGVTSSYVASIDMTFENDPNFDRVEISLDQKGSVTGFDGESENCIHL